MPRKPKTLQVAATFSRPQSGPRLSSLEQGEAAASELFGGSELPLGDSPAWQSNGGPWRGHPARSLPFTLEVPLPGTVVLTRLHLVGIFALFGGREDEAAGTLGASVQVNHERETTFRFDLLNGRHYSDGRELEPVTRLNGDGTSLETLGQLEFLGAPARVDVLTLDLPPDTLASEIRFKDLGSPASFLIFDVVVEAEAGQGCPFHSGSGGVALGEIGSIVRVGDRVRFLKALEQLESSLLGAEDLDEARGQALTFLAVVTAAMLETGGSRQMHRVQLQAARKLDQLTTTGEIAKEARAFVESVADSLVKVPQGPSSYLVDRALAIVERNFAKDLSDSMVADQLGLSTSHFRFLFKEATGQPFHKYLVALRLEKARQMLLEEEIAVSAVAKAVGFAGLSHFSRAFTQRFSVSPTSVRRGAE